MYFYSIPGFGDKWRGGTLQGRRSIRCSIPRLQIRSLVSDNLGVEGLIYAHSLSHVVAWAVGMDLACRFLHAALDIISMV